MVVAFFNPRPKSWSTLLAAAEQIAPAHAPQTPPVSCRAAAATMVEMSKATTAAAAERATGVLGLAKEV